MCASREGYVDLKVCSDKGITYIWLLRARDKRSWKSKRNRSLSSSDNSNDRYTCEVIRLAFKHDRESWEGIDKSAPGVKSLRNGSTPDRNTPVTYTYAYTNSRQLCEREIARYVEIIHLVDEREKGKKGKEIFQKGIFGNGNGNFSPRGIVKGDFPVWVSGSRSEAGPVRTESKRARA